MKSIRTKTTLLTVCAIVIAVSIATFIGVIAIRNTGNRNSEQMLTLLCETGEMNLDSYFESVENTVKTVSGMVEDDLRDLPRDQLAEHISRARSIFARMALQAHGVLTYYYRIDPSVSRTEKGFWYVNLSGSEFREHEVTDIQLYDTANTDELVWFTVPKATGKAIWLPPYITDNLNVRVISYNVPVYWDEKFIGVIGMEIDYSTMAQEVDHIQLYENGYAFITDSEGSLIYHPHIDVALLNRRLEVPEGLLSEESIVTYTYDGIRKKSAWRPLSNGMRLYVTVPVAEIDRDWQNLIRQILLASVVVLILVSVVTMRFTSRIIEPLKVLTEAARQVNDGNFEVSLNYENDDEIGVLTNAFSKLINYLKHYIGDLNALAYADALTSVRNKAACDIYARGLQTRVEESDTLLEYAIGFFDCNYLKRINDEYGHDKGDIYLRDACRMICNVFQHSPVFRVGGDEFAVILEGDDFRNRENLVQTFRERVDASQKADVQPWEKCSIAMGVAVYDPAADRNVSDVMSRADKLMYQDKRLQKEKDRK